MWLPLSHPLLGTWPTTQMCALTGNQTSDSLVRKPALNPLSHTSQGFEWTFININSLVSDKVTSVSLNPTKLLLRMTLQLLKASFFRWGN